MIKNEAEIFGFLFLGDGARISRCQLLNILDSTKNIPISALEIVYFQGHLADGNKKDGKFINNQFLNSMREIDPDNQQFPIQQLVCFSQKPVYSTEDILILCHHHLKITTQIFLLPF